MPRYYDLITEATRLSQKLGSALAISPEFQILSSTIISRCVFMQHLIQQIIYSSHGPELAGAKRALKEFPNPKARVDFLCSAPFNDGDPVVAKVFAYARGLFAQIYELRNVLAHEVWASSETYPNAVLFSSLDENARLLWASGRLWHREDATPQETYDATVRFIRSVKVVLRSHLETAISDADTCNWALMHVNTVLNESDPIRREEARRAFFVYRGTSHLFPEAPASSGTVEFSASRNQSRP